jgi:hypothetical protein
MLFSYFYACSCCKGILVVFEVPTLDFHICHFQENIMLPRKVCLLSFLVSLACNLPLNVTLEKHTLS